MKRVLSNSAKRFIAKCIGYQAVAATVHAGGLAQAAWASSGTISNPTSGYRTLIDPSYAIRQNCYLTSVKIQVANVVAGKDAWSFRVYRWNSIGSVYDFVAKQDFTAVASTQTITLSPPIAVIPGDILGIMFPGEATQGNWVERTTVTHDPQFRYVDVDVLTNNAFASVISNTWHPNIEVFTNSKPYLVVTGDSIIAGHNGGNLYYGGLDNDATPKTIPGAASSTGQQAEPAYKLRGLIGNGSVLNYQNLGCGGQTMAWVLSTALAEVNAISPNTVIIHCGANDIKAARTWGAYSSDLSSIRSGLTAGIRLLVDEILPGSYFNDAEAGNLRTFNANLDTWCAANNARLIRCHDPMAIIRAGTGKLDDYDPTYDAGDGLHLSLTGVAKLAAIHKGYL